jgi:hypothetical protein
MYSIQEHVQMYDFKVTDKLRSMIPTANLVMFEYFRAIIKVPTVKRKLDNRMIVVNKIKKEKSHRAVFACKMKKVLTLLIDKLGFCLMRVHGNFILHTSRFTFNVVCGDIEMHVDIEKDNVEICSHTPEQRENHNKTAIVELIRMAIDQCTECRHSEKYLIYLGARQTFEYVENSTEVVPKLDCWDEVRWMLDDCPCNRND